MSRKNSFGMSAKDDSLSLYYKDVEGTHLLTRQEERVQIMKYHDCKDPDARDLIIKGALRYVIAEARKHPRSRDRAVLEDLIAAGNIGLIRALNKFDPNQGTRFLTYAGWWVRHEMREEGRRIGIVHIPAHAIAKGVRSPISTELTETLVPSVTDDAIAVLNTQQSTMKLLTLTQLSTHETFIIKSCYGVHTQPKTLKQIGKLLIITGERVRQLRESALSKLRGAATSNRITL